jgi:hypothetical protein
MFTQIYEVTNLLLILCLVAGKSGECICELMFMFEFASLLSQERKTKNISRTWQHFCITHGSWIFFFVGSFQAPSDELSN